MALISSLLSAAVLGTCDLTGDWTSVGHTLPTGLPVHIEITMVAPVASSGNWTVRADPWKGATSQGKVFPDGKAAVFMVGGQWEPGIVSASPHGVKAPGCTYLSWGWCKFPYCDVPEPSSWPPFAPPSPCPIPPYSPPRPAEKRISCGVDTTKPCPLPKWKPTWDLARSTAIQPCNASGWYDPAYAAKWGLVSFDWSNAKADWLAVSPHDCEERLVEQCKLIKQINPDVKCFVYRNTELALEWLTSQRAVMDLEHAGYFLQFQSDAAGKAADKCGAAGPCTWAPAPGRPSYKYGSYCCPFGTVYCENQDPWQGERQFFWDFTNTSLQSWWVDNFFLGKNGAGGANPWVDGCFSDDVGGLPQEHGAAIARMGYTPKQTDAIQTATQETWQRAVDKLAASGGYNWQMFGNSDGTAAPPTEADCATRMEELCAPEMQRRPMMMGAGFPKGGSINTTLAAFLVTRPPYGYIGYGWQGCGAPTESRDAWNPLFALEVGSPTASCTQTKKGVFTRTYTAGTATLDCNTFTAALDFQMSA